MSDQGFRLLGSEADGLGLDDDPGRGKFGKDVEAGMAQPVGAIDQQEHGQRQDHPGVPHRKSNHAGEHSLLPPSRAVPATGCHRINHHSWCVA